MMCFATLRRRRSLLGAFAIFVLLAAQLAISAYACPLLESDRRGEAPPPCHQIDPESPVLCKAFLQSDEQSPDGVRGAPDFSAALPLGLALDVVAPQLEPLARGAAQQAAAVPPATPPPLIVLLGRRRD